jgi:hypothetical protein
VALDAAGNECATAHLTRDGRFLLGKGCTAGLYLDEAGDVVERKELLAADAEGNELSPGRRYTQGRAEPAALDEFLDHVVVTAHLLVPELMDPALEAVLRRGDVFRVCRGAGTTTRDQPTYLLANDQGVFLLEAQHCGFEQVRLEQPILDADVLSMGEANDEFSFDLGWETADEPA